MKRLYRYYSLDECLDEEGVIEYLDELEVMWSMMDQYTFELSISDISEYDERLLIEFFHEKNVIPSSDFEDDDDMGDYFSDY